MYVEEYISEEQEITSFDLARIKENPKKHVLDGWARCREYGLAPYDYVYANKLTGIELENVLLENRELIQAARPFMENLYSLVKGTGFAVILADKNGCLLEIIGDEEPLNILIKKINIAKGILWEERTLGNTAITTSIMEKKPIQLSGSEHYLAVLRMFTCSSSPIRKDSKIIGALNVMGYEDKTHLHTLGMVVAATKSIESYMEMDEINNELMIKNKYQSAITECISDGFLTIDSCGNLTYINAEGADILGIDKICSIGKHIKDLVDFDPVVLDVLKTGKGYQDKEFIIRDKYGGKHHFIKSATPIKDAEGNIVGVIDNFRKIKRVHTMVRKIVGAYGKFNFDDIIGQSKKMQESIRLAKIAAKSSSNVLVYGESGTGKELIVQSIHNGSLRKNESFISINCAAIPGELIESELFGYEGGAFTGALKNGQTGKFELANGGTIFLDEIGDMPLHLQGKLLRVLQENQITRVGGSNIIDVDVRIICATNKNLLLECKRGNFREDLYYRLNVLNINIPPLRERKDDMEKLVYHFIKKINKKMNKNVNGITKGALETLMDYDWPGNVRELENTIERAINICTGNEIQLQHLVGDLIIKNEADNFPRYQDFDQNNDEKIEAKFKIKSLDQIEREAIMRTLEITEGNITRAAEGLNISRNTLYNKLRRYEIEKC